MNDLTPALLGHACDIFLALAYPDGSIPPTKQAFANIRADQPLDSLLQAPVCQVLTGEGGTRKYAFRLGSTVFPHVKLQVCCVHGCVFAVDTHDAIRIDPADPDAERWGNVQAANRQLKEKIERAWEAAGLLTFNALLRRELENHQPMDTATPKDREPSHELAKDG
jgi:hypothetical protein